MDDPTIRATVIIPAYNGASTLAKAVESALDQTETNIEIIIVDDCSTDDTWAVVLALAKRDPRIRTMRLPRNSRKSYAVNRATEQARGEWIAILDADDWYARERLKRLIDAAVAQGMDMVADNQMLVDVKAGVDVGTAFPAEGNCLTLDLDGFLEGSDPTARFDYGMLKPVFRASFLRQHKIEYYEPTQNGQDYYILLWFFVVGGKAVVIDEPLYYYRQPFGTFSRTWSQEGRRRYNYELMKEAHDHFMHLFSGRLSPSQMQRLSDRGRGIEATMRFHQLKERLHARDVRGAANVVLVAPSSLWTMLARRLFTRLGASYARRAQRPWHSM